MQISSMINGPDGLSAESLAFSPQFLLDPIKKGFNGKLSFRFVIFSWLSSGSNRLLFPPCYADHFFKPQKSNNFHILKDFF